jgi:choline dehydrogenase-like flavoprotein
MGMEASNSVVNSYGQTHQISNLYVAGPGIFATSGASNPTYTMFALSLRGGALATREGTYLACPCW